MDFSFDDLEAVAKNKNYLAWRATHGKMFGGIFLNAFGDSIAAQIQLTAALTDISKRQFDAAVPKLNELESLADTDADVAAIAYFSGLNSEMRECEGEMNSYYEKLLSLGVKFEFPLALHPYYRTAKFAQKASECGKALYYYRKALSFYDGIKPTRDMASTVSHLLYEAATVSLYMHSYDECKTFLDASELYDKSENQQRTYVRSVLCAANGDEDESRRLASSLDDFLKERCEPLIGDILSGADLHYCEVECDGTVYSDFWDNLLIEADGLEEKIAKSDTGTAENIINGMLTATFAFMNRDLECRIEYVGGIITVLCKTYFTKTLAREQARLFSVKPQQLAHWKFGSIEQFEIY
jgi:hypothetical protein